MSGVGRRPRQGCVGRSGRKPSGFRACGHLLATIIQRGHLRPWVSLFPVLPARTAAFPRTRFHHNITFDAASLYWKRLDNHKGETFSQRMQGKQTLTSHSIGESVLSPGAAPEGLLGLTWPCKEGCHSPAALVALPVRCPEFKSPPIRFRVCNLRQTSSSSSLSFLSYKVGAIMSGLQGHCGG